ncbi:unnamed protein product [Aphanomyces euteiches]|uniref:Uncharacterized protein n=1 Tax=Aphanomyces euteiches TaxID=100861 RepID=A0A6G0WZJ2_9STRA|nr:hypothetical protein Ae201684_010086 [Aphanomyces euteiches]KAH9099514.1 hypothetical protein Ae201684P_018527 [Aphanomyces euteiches]KAH9154520.1 hypothetical protein AeRB84_003400 [Aphanomyces euteiches]
MFGFGKPTKTPREQAREAKREISHSQRDIEREKMALERQERQLIADIKRAAKERNQAGTKILAKQLIQVRQQKDKMTVMKSSLGSMSLQTTSMAAQMTMVTAMEKSTKTMAATSKQMDMGRFQKVIMEFEKQNEMMGVKEEMINDSLIDAFDDEEIEVEGDAVVDQVLTEIGLDLGQLMADAPRNEAASISQILGDTKPAAVRSQAANAPLQY